MITLDFDGWNNAYAYSLFRILDVKNDREIGPFPYCSIMPQDLFLPVDKDLVDS